MLTGRFEAIPGEGEQVTPTTWQSMTDSFKSNYLSGFSILPGIEDRPALQKSVETLDAVANAGDQGWGQWSANKISGFAGAVLNPISLLAGEGLGAVAGKAIGGAGTLVGKHIPVSAAAVATGIGQKTLGSIVTKLPNWIGEQTVGGVAKGAVKTFAMGTGFSLPEEVARTYNSKDDSFNWWGGIKAASEDGGIGLGLMAVPYLAGAVWGKAFNRATEAVTHTDMPMPKEGAVAEGVEPNHPAITKIDEAKESGRISPEHAEFFKDYLTGKSSNADLTNKAVELLIKDGQPVDAAAKQVLFNMFKPEDIDNLHTAIADELASTVPSHMKNMLSDFMLKGKLDEYRSKASMADGIDGVVQFVKKRLERSQDEEKSLSKILKTHLPDDTSEPNPLTQREIYKAEKTGNKLGAAIPIQVSKRLTQENKIKFLQDRIKSYEKEFAKTGDKLLSEKIAKHQNTIMDVKNNLEPLLSHKDEMKYLRERLLKDGKPKENFHGTKEHDRLLDLTRARNDARRLSHELNASHAKQMQGHYANVLDTITKVMRSSVGKLADQNSVIDYMKERLIRTVPDAEKIAEKQAPFVRKGEIKNEVNSLDESRTIEDETSAQQRVIENFDREMENAPKEIKEEYEVMRDKLKEFSASKGVFNNLIKCVMGTLNG